MIEHAVDPTAPIVFRRPFMAVLFRQSERTNRDERIFDAISHLRNDRNPMIHRDTVYGTGATLVDQVQL